MYTDGQIIAIGEGRRERAQSPSDGRGAKTER